MAKKRRIPVRTPDILAVQRDSSIREKGTAQGRPIPSDCLSVYMQGGPRYQLGRHTYRFTPPIAILIPEGTLDWDLQHGRIEGVAALFRGRGLITRRRGHEGQSVVQLGSNRLVTPYLKKLSEAEAERIAVTLHEITSTTGAGLAARMRRAGLLFQAIAEYCRTGGGEEEHGLHREAMRLRELIEQTAFQARPMAEIYREINLSAAHAGTLFRRAFGMTPVAYRNNLRLRKARELLVSSKRNVSEVAFEVGFSDALYFSRVFRRTYGATPSSLIRDFSSKRR